MKVLIVPLAALALFGCASPDYGTRDLALVDATKSGAREALQQRLGPANCRTKAHGDAARLADAGEVSVTAAAFVVGAERYAQLDDPTKDWTRQQAAGPSAQCPASGRKHRYFA
ncbi:MAG TPA: hypothetical protein VHY79_04860 [Rhizomicrobium sp.]|nr:hypothetical protein [Rhizomicrobium sp.]